MIVSIAFMLVCQLAMADNFEHVVWDKSPINIKLPIEKERMVVFQEPVKLVHNELEGFAIIQKTKDTFYLKALRGFAPKSVVVRGLPDGKIIKLNASADESYINTAPLQIISKESTTTDNEQANISPGTPINYVTLTRLAIQSLYAPERVLEMPQEVGRVPMNTQKTVSLISGGGVMAHPLLSFGGDGLNVTAIRINNLLSKSQEIEPDMLYGKWGSIAFYPSNRLAPKGKDGDESVVFVTSTKPFGEALIEIQGYVR
jgi:integrating conjugative element protein (TIGR03749 family)